LTSGAPVKTATCSIIEPNSIGCQLPRALVGAETAGGNASINAIFKTEGFRLTGEVNGPPNELYLDGIRP
jgi:hypothetical protein